MLGRLKDLHQEAGVLGERRGYPGPDDRRLLHSFNSPHLQGF